MFINSVIPRLDRGIQRKDLDFPVKPENDNIGTKFAMNKTGKSTGV